MGQSRGRGQLGKISALICIILFTSKLWAFNNCYYLFQPHNLTQYFQSLRGSPSHKIHQVLSQGGHWLKIDSSLDIISHLRYRVWQPNPGQKVKQEVVLIGGLGQTAERFDQNSEFMRQMTKAGIKVIFLELPGQGHTSILHELENGKFKKVLPSELFLVLDSALEQLKQNKIIKSKKFQIMGHSYGGWLLTEYLNYSKRMDISKVHLLDTGLKSFHNEGMMYWLDPFFSFNPFYKSFRNHSLTHYLKQMLKKDKEHYKNDPLKLDYAASLYLGIMDYNALSKAKYISDFYKMRVFIAENTEFGSHFKNMIKDFYRKLNVIDKKLIVLENSPHNLFLYTPAAKKLILEVLKD